MNLHQNHFNASNNVQLINKTRVNQLLELKFLHHQRGEILINLIKSKQINYTFQVRLIVSHDLDFIIDYFSLLISINVFY